LNLPVYISDRVEIIAVLCLPRISIVAFYEEENAIIDFCRIFVMSDVLLETGKYLREN